ncbi:MAG TPA: hypothetical protein VFN75_06310 [Pseudonocardiaceae bacterium]|nr:hypothetical protein [Pseudonocardiaceae bacterium]
MRAVFGPVVVTAALAVVAVVHEDVVAALVAARADRRLCAVRLGMSVKFAQLLSSPVWRDSSRGEQLPGGPPLA